jgi:hypothetical protein
MKELSAEQLLANWNEFLGYIDKYIPGERGKKLRKFYEDRAERFMYMPASSVEHYHSAFPGGYIEHVNRVIRATLDITELWSKYGSPLDCTTEELVFTAMNHDLGKYGNDEHPFYIPNSSDWHRKNQGKIYEYSDDLPKMQVPDRSIFLLTQNGISFTENEYIGIKIHDGMYDEANKYYLAGYGGWTQKLKSSLGYIVHQADMMAARVEFEEWRDNYREGAPKKVSKPKQAKAVSTADKPINEGQAKAFDDLFKDIAN